MNHILHTGLAMKNIRLCLIFFFLLICCTEKSWSSNFGNPVLLVSNEETIKIQFQEADTKILIVDDHNFFHLFDIQKQEIVKKIHCSTHNNQLTIYDDNRIIIQTNEQQIIIYNRNLENRQSICTDYKINRFLLAHTVLLISNNNNELGALSLETGARLRVVKGIALQSFFNAHDKKIYFSHNNTIYFCINSLNTATLILTHSEHITSFFISSNNSIVFSSYSGIYEFQNNKITLIKKSYTKDIAKAVNKIIPDPHGKKFIIVFGDGTISLREIGIDKDISSVPGENCCADFSFSSGGHFIAKLINGSLVLYETSKGEQVTLLGSPADITAFDIDARGTKLITSHEDGRILLWHFEENFIEIEEESDEIASEFFML